MGVVVACDGDLAALKLDLAEMGIEPRAIVPGRRLVRLELPTADEAKAAAARLNGSECAGQAGDFPPLAASLL